MLKGIIGACGGIPSDLDSNEVYQPMDGKALYLYGNEDEFYPFEKLQKFEKRLDSYLPEFESKSYDAKHEITNDMREDTMNQSLYYKKKFPIASVIFIKFDIFLKRLLLFARIL